MNYDDQIEIKIKKLFKKNPKNSSKKKKILIKKIKKNREKDKGSGDMSIFSNLRERYDHGYLI